MKRLVVVRLCVTLFFCRKNLQTFCDLAEWNIKWGQITSNSDLKDFHPANDDIRLVRSACAQFHRWTTYHKSLFMYFQSISLNIWIAISSPQSPSKISTGNISKGKPTIPTTTGFGACARVLGTNALALYRFKWDQAPVSLPVKFPF